MKISGFVIVDIEKEMILCKRDGFYRYIMKKIKKNIDSYRIFVDIKHYHIYKIKKNAQKAILKNNYFKKEYNTEEKRKVLKVLKIEFDIKGIELECNM